MRRIRTKDMTWYTPHIFQAWDLPHYPQSRCGTPLADRGIRLNAREVHRRQRPSAVWTPACRRVQHRLLTVSINEIVSPFRTDGVDPRALRKCRTQLPKPVVLQRTEDTLGLHVVHEELRCVVSVFGHIRAVGKTDEIDPVSHAYTWRDHAVAPSR